MTVRIYSLEETRQILKNTLRRAFPRTRFQLNPAGYADLDIHWRDGPNISEVQHISHSFEGASILALAPLKFRSPHVTFNGRLAQFQVDTINTCREHSRSLLIKAAVLVATECNLPVLVVTQDKRIIGGRHTVPYQYALRTNTFTYSTHGGEYYFALILQAVQGLSCESPAPVLLPTRSTEQLEVAL